MELRLLIGTRLREQRLANGWTQQRVASKLGISVPSVSKIESGSIDLNYSRLEQLAHVYNQSIFELITGRKPQIVNDASYDNILQRLSEYDSLVILLQGKIIFLHEEIKKKSAGK